MTIHKGSLDWFQKQMKEKLEFNNYKTGWHHLYVGTLRNLLKSQWNGLNEALRNDDSEEIVSKCANIANYAMMIADNSQLAASEKESSHEDQ